MKNKINNSIFFVFVMLCYSNSYSQYYFRKAFYLNKPFDIRNGKVKSIEEKITMESHDIGTIYIKTFNSKNQIIKDDKFDINKNWLETTKYEYNRTFFKVISESQLINNEGEIVQGYTYKYIYDDSNNLQNIKVYQNNNELILNFETNIDSSGSLYKMISYDLDYKLETYEIAEYDYISNKAKIKMYDYDDNLIEQYIFSIDDNAVTKNTEIGNKYDRLGNLIKSQSLDIEIVYDDFDNWISMKYNHVDEDRKHLNQTISRKITYFDK